MNTKIPLYKTQLDDLIKVARKEDKDIIESLMKTYIRFGCLTDKQAELVNDKWQLYKKLRKVSGPRYGEFNLGKKSWDDPSMTPHGLKKQLDLLGVSTFTEAVNKVRKMQPDERKAWLELANTVANLPHDEMGQQE